MGNYPYSKSLAEPSSVKVAFAHKSLADDVSIHLRVTEVCLQSQHEHHH